VVFDAGDSDSKTPMMARRKAWRVPKIKGARKAVCFAHTRKFRRGRIKAVRVLAYRQHTTQNTMT
jgi:hypothetical protein